MDINSVGLALNDISNEILFKLRSEGIDGVLDHSTHHVYRDTWERTSIKQALLEPWRDKIDIDKLSVEVITNSGDKGEIHYHDDSYAVVTFLGPREHFEEPKGCVYYFYSKEDPNKVLSGITLQILPRVIHGFRSPDGCPPVVFLSVQSKKIIEDFFPV
ncbi:MAG: hypothetical protein JWM20_487 [Patescibacteria group bacterium]|nr:hypothetical protein [Patescibacteria group bacterium]